MASMESRTDSASAVSDKTLQTETLCSAEEEEVAHEGTESDYSEDFDEHDSYASSEDVSREDVSSSLANVAEEAFEEPSGKSVM